MKYKILLSLIVLAIAMLNPFRGYCSTVEATEKSRDTKAGFLEDALYLVGEVSNWEYKDEFKFETRDDNVYILNMDELEGPFAIYGENWSPKYSADGLVVDDYTTYLLEENIDLGNLTTGDYKFTQIRLVFVRDMKKLIISGRYEDKFVYSVDGQPLNFRIDYESENSVALCDGMDYYGNLVIPETVSYEGVEYKVEEIENLGECRLLESIRIPDSIKKIDSSWAFDCPSLKSIVVSEYNKFFSSDKGILFNFNKTVLLSCPNSLESVEIPNTVSELYPCSFYNCKLLKEVRIPESVYKIRALSFAHCESLTSVDISDSVVEIEFGAFYGCESLTDINLPEYLTLIWSDLFENCKSLKTVTISERMEFVSIDAFEGCNSLERIICLAIAPPEIYDTEEAGMVCENLYVPAESVEAYKESAWAKYFRNIKPVVTDSVDSIEGEGNVITVSMNGNEIIVSGVGENEEISVYDMAGRIVYSGYERNIHLDDNGVYILKTPFKTVKVTL